jgi:hypothetical protein
MISVVGFRPTARGQPEHRANKPKAPLLHHPTWPTYNATRIELQELWVRTSPCNLDVVANVGGVPCIPTKPGPEQWRKLWHLFNYRRGEFDRHYHKRSNVETTFSAIKRKFGGAVRSKKYERQVNEVLPKVQCFNLSALVHEMFELGVESAFYRG